MPGDLPPRPRGWQAGALGLVALMMYVAWWSIEASAVPNGYLARRGWEVAIDGPWRFPHEQVRTWLSAMAVEGALVIWALSARWATSLAVRSLMLAAAAALTLVCISPLLMHASAPFPQHMAWLLLATAWLLLVSLAAALGGRMGRAGLVCRAAPEVR